MKAELTLSLALFLTLSLPVALPSGVGSRCPTIAGWGTESVVALEFALALAA